MLSGIKQDFTFLAKVLIKPFYAENAGQIFTVVLVCFGLFPGFAMLKEAHYGIMIAICTSPLAMFASCLLWTAYAYKCFAFVLRELSLSQNECLYIIGLGKPFRNVFLLFIFQLVLFVPVLLYVFFTLFIGIGSGYHLQPFIIFIFLSALNLLISFIYSYQFRNPQEELKLPFGIPAFKRSWDLPFYLYPISHFIGKRKLMLFVTKVISFSLIWLGFYLAHNQDLDIRFVYITMVGSILAHSILVQHLRDFENKNMTWMLNIPLRLSFRFIGYLILFFFLILPEVFFIFKYAFNQISYAEVPNFLVLGIAGLSFLHSVLYIKDMNETKFMNYQIGFLLGLIMAIQFRIPILVISIALLSLAYLTYKRRYYLYE